MRNLKKLILALMVVATVCVSLPREADADGPLRRWWRNFRNRNNSAAQFPDRQTAFSPQVAGSNSRGLQPGQCMRTCQQTCRRTVVNYVPQTAYRTAYKRVPVTRFRPVTNSDPCTGCTVTCMRPCTTYTYQVQRVPYTTYRPVYRTETYRVPVTTITNGCATGGCNTCPTPATTSFSPSNACNTCATPGFAGQGLGQPGSTVPTPGPTTQTFTVDPSTGLSTQGSFDPSPASQVPSLNGVPNPQSTQQPSFVQPPAGAGSTSRRIPTGPLSVHDQVHQPVVNSSNRTASNPVRQSWDYTPIRFASSSNLNERRLTPYSSQPNTRSSSGNKVTERSSDSRLPVRRSRWVEVQ